MHRIDLPRRLLLLASVIPTLGCDSADERLASHAQHSTAQQAKQNEAIAEQSRSMASQIQEVASAAHELVQQDATARRELLEALQQLHEHIQEERSVVDRQREQVEMERKSVARASVREPLIAQEISTTGLLLAALLPLLVTAYAIRRLPDQSPATELFAGALLDDLLEQPASRPREPVPPSLADTDHLR